MLLAIIILTTMTWRLWGFFDACNQAERDAAATYAKRQRDEFERAEEEFVSWVHKLRKQQDDGLAALDIAVSRHHH